MVESERRILSCNWAASTFAGVAAIAWPDAKKKTVLGGVAARTRAPLITNAIRQVLSIESMVIPVVADKTVSCFSRTSFDPDAVFGSPRNVKVDNRHGCSVAVALLSDQIGRNYLLVTAPQLYWIVAAAFRADAVKITADRDAGNENSNKNEYTLMSLLMHLLRMPPVDQINIKFGKFADDE